MSAERVAIVILNWNGENFLRKFLPSVVSNSQVEGVSIVVADNGSTDGSLALLKERFPSVSVVKLDKNYGFAEGYNRALKQLNSFDYYILLNSDVEVPPGWLLPLLDYMGENPEVAACAPAIMDYYHPSKFEYAGAAGGFIDCFGYPFCRGRLLDEVETDDGQYADIIDVFWASGACMMVRSDLFEQLGGFDGTFFAHMEEIDLCWRMRNAGYRIVAIPQSRVFHVGGGTLPNNNPYKLYLNFRNSLFTLHKNLDSLSLFPIIIVRLLLDLLSASAYLLTLRFPYVKAVCKAHLHYYAAINRLNSFRRHSARRPFRAFTTVYRGSIIFDFFIRRRRKFSQLPLYERKCD